MFQWSIYGKSRLLTLLTLASTNVRQTGKRTKRALRKMKGGDVRCTNCLLDHELLLSYPFVTDRTQASQFDEISQRLLRLREDRCL